MLIEPPENADRAAHQVIGAALAVHRALGPGFAESVYENALCLELDARGVHDVRVTLQGSVRLARLGFTA